jgi:hypothetical protein
MPKTPWIRLSARSTRGQTVSSFYRDRRKKTPFNRFRRLFNSYWLVPLFTAYLELFALFLPPGDVGLNHLLERNRSFFNGITVLYHLSSYDFPYTLVGHGKEIVIRNAYDLNVRQVPFSKVAEAAKDRTTATGIYLRLIGSRSHKNTELGGVVTLSDGPEGPWIHFYEVGSLNGAFSENLRRAGQGTVLEFLAWSRDKEHREFIQRVGISESLLKHLDSVLSSPKIRESQKKKLIDGFIDTFDLYSESRYILSPDDFKSYLGSHTFEGRYVGVFHFHNGLMEPPSEADVAGSFNDRQIVLTLTDQGFLLYDVVKGVEKTVEVRLERS